MFIVEYRFDYFNEIIYKNIKMLKKVNNKVDFIELEHEILDFWKRKNIFEKRKKMTFFFEKKIELAKLSRFRTLLRSVK